MTIMTLVITYTPTHNFDSPKLEIIKFRVNYYDILHLLNYF